MFSLSIFSSVYSNNRFRSNTHTLSLGQTHTLIEQNQIHFHRRQSSIVKRFVRLQIYTLYIHSFEVRCVLSNAFRVIEQRFLEQRPFDSIANNDTPKWFSFVYRRVGAILCSFMHMGTATIAGGEHTRTTGCGDGHHPGGTRLHSNGNLNVILMLRKILRGHC